MISSNNGISQLPEFRSLRIQTEAPVFTAIFPDGQRVLVSGVPEQEARLLAREEAEEPSGAVFGCIQVIRQFIPDFHSSELTAYTEGMHFSQPTPYPYSLVALEALAQMLSDFDIPAHLEQAQSSEDLAYYLESGSGVLVAINLGELWNTVAVFDNGDANAVAVAVAVAREPQTGTIVGWYLNDVVAKQSCIPVEADRMKRAWLDSGGWLIVTEIVTLHEG